MSKVKVYYLNTENNAKGLTSPTTDQRNAKSISLRLLIYTTECINDVYTYCPFLPLVLPLVGNALAILLKPICLHIQRPPSVIARTMALNSPGNETSPRNCSAP